MNIILEIDKWAVFFIQDHINSPYADNAIKFISSLGNKGFIFVLLTVSILFLGRDKRELFFTCALSLILSALFCNILLKPLVSRIRPYDAFNLKIIVERLKDYSFPSGHTSAAFAFGVSVFMYNKPKGYAFIIFGLLMAFTRLYLRVHFLSDVVFGMLLGTACALLSYYAVNRLKEHLISKNNAAGL